MSLTLEQLLWTVLLAPLASAAVSALFLRKSRLGAPVLACVASGISLVAATAAVLARAPGDAPALFSYPWLSLGAFEVNLGFQLDANASLMLLVVAFTAFCIHLFSVGYMRGAAGKGRFFAGLSVFLFSIFGIVLASNLYMLFFFWELVGFSSYLLIAQYFEKPDAASASKKAFIVNRVGDLGFLAGIVLCRAWYGTVDFSELGLLAAAPGMGKSTAVAALLACGFMGKSAQFPLHVWLPDAMAGPTPVSALIHAATMVAAGVYFMARVFFLLTPTVLGGLLWICALTALLAALCAIAQTDIKRSLAYSTLSHLGIMGAAIGLGFPELAMLHLAAHALFKATLFLCAGSVIHACHHEQDMTRMGGMLRRLPVTSLAFVFAAAALCALPGSAGWFSKDAILSAALVEGRFGIFALLIGSAAGSALYMGRMFHLVFLGNARGTAPAHARESSPWMLAPLLALGVLALPLFSATFLPGHAFPWDGGLLNGVLPASAAAAVLPRFHEVHHALAGSGLFLPVLFAGIVATGAGLSASLLFYRSHPVTPGADPLGVALPHLFRALEFRWMDTIYDFWLVRVQNPLCNAIAFFDSLFINGLAVRGCGAGIPALLGLLSRLYLHTGNARATLWWLAIGAFLCTGGILLF
ncbi:MAG: NADH-quinone oxidoreductase subunit L [Puniceicoccales bacterium]|jgi:NADH-quinone oxidoreductase subunit L|nr:NADH-quinone oxidoreductase subunit L [Puniceicoccales bacterium]